MNLPDPNAPEEADWAAEITAAAVGEMNAVISIYNGTAVILAHRRARVQHIRRPILVAAADSLTTVRDFMFQIDLLPGDPNILKGYVIRVENGGDDPQLTQFAYSVRNATNASHAALRSIQAQSELAPVPAVP